jgi:hypothetical protein
VSFGPFALGSALANLRRTAETVTARGDYPEDLGFEFSL